MNFFSKFSKFQIQILPPIQQLLIMFQYFLNFRKTLKNVIRSKYQISERNFGLSIPRAMAFSSDHDKFKIDLERQNDIVNRSDQANVLAMYQKEKKDSQEKQRQRLIERQQEMQKYNRERQEERQKQKQQYMVFSSFVSIACLVVIYRYIYQPWSKEKEFRNKYRKLPIFRSEQVKGSQVQKQIDTIFQDYSMSQIKMIVGSPGIGKSSGLRQVLKRYKEKGSQIFYFTFQSSTSQEDCTESANNLLKFLSNLQNFYRESDFKRKKVKVVIDDINKIDELQNRQFARRIMTKMYGFASSQSIDLICLSSQSTFVEKFKNNNEYFKSVKTYVLQSEHTEEFIHNIIRAELEERYHKNLKKELKKDEKFWEDFKVVSKQIFSFGFSLRFIQLEICPLISQRLNRMEEAKAQNKISELLKQVNAIKLMEQNKDQLKMRQIANQDSRIFENMIKNMLLLTSFENENCMMIKNGNKVSTAEKIIQQLNKENLIMFCRPRTKKEKAAFERFLKKRFNQ